jgi:hypothetical protein
MSGYSRQCTKTVTRLYNIVFCILSDSTIADVCIIVIIIIGSRITAMPGSNIYSDASDLLEVDELTM